MGLSPIIATHLPLLVQFLQESNFRVYARGIDALFGDSQGQNISLMGFEHLDTSAELKLEHFDVAIGASTNKLILYQGQDPRETFLGTN